MNNEKYTLIMPMLNPNAEGLPIEFQFDNISGKMNCIRSLESIDVSLFTSVHFIILNRHETKYDISSKIALGMSNSKILNNLSFYFSIVEHPTSSQAETVYNEIIKQKITGPIFIKDADNVCVCKNIIKGNSVLVYPLEATPIVDPQHKSYVSVDDQNFVINIIEKRIVSNLFNCGGYSFNSANDYKTAFEALLNYEDINNHMYISHIIYWLILNKKLKFRPIEATEYEDFDLKNRI